VEGSETTSAQASAREGAGAIFVHFLAFGARAFGGPVAQIGDLSSEFVTRRGWVTPERFRRALAVYQLLPGPEAHEMCCYLGAARGGWRGAIAAGLGFMLPGLACMLAMCALYARLDLREPAVAGAMAAMQVAASALIVRAAWRLAAPMRLADWRLLATLLASVALSAWWFAAEPSVCPASDGAARQIGAPVLFGHGLTAGLVTFGGAYTAIPYVTGVASGAEGWMTRGEVLDGVAIASVLPAPLVIFGTFVGWRGGGLVGALAFTAGIFLPAFAFTVFGFSTIERILAWRPARAALDVASAVAIGVIIGAAAHIVVAPLSEPALGRMAIPLFAVVLGAVILWRARLAAPVLVVAAALAGAAIGAAGG
jgi:chromate transporter